MPRQDRNGRNHHTPLAKFLRRVLEDRRMSQKQMSEIAGVSESVLSAWMMGAYPSETVVGLKRLCDHTGESLSIALTGLPDKCLGSIEGSYLEELVFDGIARIKIERLIPRRRT